MVDRAPPPVGPPRAHDRPPPPGGAPHAGPPISLSAPITNPAIERRLEDETLLAP